MPMVQVVGMNYKNLDDHKQTEGKNRSDLSILRTLRTHVIRLSNYLVILSIFSSFFFAPVSVSAVQISLGLGFLGWMTNYFCTPKLQNPKIILTPITTAYLIFLLAAVFSILFSQDKIATLDSFRSFWKFFAFLLAANWIRNVKNFETCLKIIFATTALACLVGLIQHFGGLEILHHFLIKPKTRATGFFGGSMTFSGLITIVSLISIAFIFSKKLSWKYLPWYLFIILIVLGLDFSFQRSAWLGFLGGILSWGIMRGKKTIFPIIAILLVFLFIIYKFQPTTWSRMSSIFKSSTETVDSIGTGERFLLWKTALQIARQHPLTGVGTGQFETTAREIIINQLKVPGGQQVTICHAHSNPFQILATMGLLGFLAYVCLWLVIFLELFKIFRRAPSLQVHLCAGVISVLIGFHIEGLFEYNFGDAEIVTLIWFLLGGMISLSKWETINQTREAKE